MDWYYAKHGKQQGPVDLASLQGMVASGEVAATDLVWRNGLPEWAPAGEVPDLAATPTVAPGAAYGVPVQGGAPVYQGGYVVPVAPTCGLAIASLVCGILSLIFCYMNAVVGIPAVICGHLALKQIRNAPLPMGGRGMAIAGLVTGYIGIVFQVFTIVGIAVVVMSEM